MRPLNVLFLCNLPTKGSNAPTVTHHITAFQQYSRHNIFCLSKTGALPSNLNLNRFDVLVIHYSIVVTNSNYLAPSAAERIGQFKGLKIQFRQDEYFSTGPTNEAMRRLGIDVIYTCVPPNEVDKVYPPQILPNVRRITTLTGFVPTEFLDRDVPPISGRPIDVSYRTRKPPYWLGELGVEKWRIVPLFFEATRDHDLVTDLSYEEKDRLYGEKWIRLLTFSKCVLGVESGASVFDFTGTLQIDVERYVSDHPEAEFEEVRDKFFAAEEGRIYMNQISPRCFEAAALRTAMILFEGKYSGILEPWRHYVPLRKDLSNIEEVVSAIRNPEMLQAIADRAYREVAMNPLYSHQHFITEFDDVIVDEFHARHKPFASAPYTRPAFRLSLLKSPDYLLHKTIIFFLQRFFLGTHIRKFLLHMWYKMPLERRDKLRPLLRFIGR